MKFFLIYFILINCSIHLIGDDKIVDKKVVTIKTPNGGIQPQALMDAKGNIHLIYFSGKNESGDLFYVNRMAGKEEFSSPIQINKTSGSAVSVGTIRGGQLALSKEGRVHVVWNGSSKVKDANGSPMMYSRMNDVGTAFEPERNLMQLTTHLDGGGSITIDQAGNIIVAWHAAKIGDKDAAGEEFRQVWTTTSTDGGKTFSKESLAWDKSTGACACCAMRIAADKGGGLDIMYRSASGGNRDIYLLRKNQNEKLFNGKVLHPWKVGSCPMSTMTFSICPEFFIAGWETDNQIYFSKFKSNDQNFDIQAVPGQAKSRKHPAIAINSKHEFIVVWAEGTSWAKGGDLAWQVYDSNGQPTEAKGRVPSGIPVWGLATVVATEKEFIIFY